MHICFAELNRCPVCPELSIHPLIEHRFPAAQSSVESPWTGRKRKNLWLEIDGYSILCVSTEPCACLWGSRLFLHGVIADSSLQHIWQNCDQDNKIAVLHKEKWCFKGSAIQIITYTPSYQSKPVVLKWFCFDWFALSVRTCYKILGQLRTAVVVSFDKCSVSFCSCNILWIWSDFLPYCIYN